MMVFTHMIAAGVLAVAGAAGAAPAAPNEAAASPHAAALAAAPHASAPRTRQDSAEALYRAGRDAISRGDFRRAAELFERVGERFPKSPQAGDALYWRAFALYRAGGTSELREARASLRELRASGRDAYRADAEALDTRVCGELARRGDAQCAATVTTRADSSLSAVVGAVGEVARAVAAVASDAARAAGAATADALRSPEVQTALTEAGRAASDMSRAAAEAVRDASRDVSRELSRELSREGRGGRRQPRDCPEEEDDVRVVALNALLQMDAERAMPLLKKVMASRERCAEVLRRKAVFLVAQKNAPEAADMLIDVARNDPDKEVREQAIFWLSRVNSERASTLLREIALQRGADVELRKNAVFSLSQLSNGRETLRQVAASDTDAEVREQAIFWLGQRGTAEDIDFLKSLYGRIGDRELKDKILFAASRRRGNAGWLLDVAQEAKEPIELRKQALFWAGQGGAEVQQLVQLYDRTNDREMKKQLVLVYQQRGSGAAFEKLLDIGRSEKDTEIRRDAIFWLSRSKDPRALKLLEDIIGK